MMTVPAGARSAIALRRADTAQIVYPLVIALATVAVIAAATQLLARSDPAWARAPS
jgi:hypothetical protein